MMKLTGPTFLLTLALALVHATALAQGRWIKLAPFPEPAE